MNAKLGSSGHRKGRLAREMTPRRAGAIATFIAFLVVFAAFHTEQIKSLAPHETVTVEFPRQFKLVEDSPYTSEVKIAGVEVGHVGDVKRTDRDTALLTLNVENGTRAKLGDAPSARVVAKLVVAGTYYVELTPGGTGDYQGDVIPLERTQMPVELEDVLDSVSTPAAMKGIQSSIGQTSKFLGHGGESAIRDLVATVPPALRPTGVVLGALRGNQPGSDLTAFVHGFESSADAFTMNNDQIRRIITSLDSTTAALAAGSKPLADSFAIGADTLRVTRAGLADLQPTLDQLTTTATEFRPAARQLDPFLQHLNPVLDRARPVVNDLKEVTDDLRPTVDRLVPTVSDATDALENLQGPALDGLNGQIQKVLYAPWHGTGVYKGGGGDRPFYKEIAYMSENIASVMANHDGNVALARLHAAAGGRSIGGQNTPMSLEQYMESMGMQQPPGPNENSSPLGPFGPKMRREGPFPGASLVPPRPATGGLLPMQRGGR